MLKIWSVVLLLYAALNPACFQQLPLQLEIDRIVSRAIGELTDKDNSPTPVLETIHGQILSQFTDTF